ncbi:PhzF family phenazine biosynthesis protein [Pseudodonghicola xiamenensis]|uniref:Phenazine biosynthesis protein PhzF n=1 Tax=Pseudodonghicola xiamenensis TaxID=337702 RepID=A0A8J3MDU7_9RHOB|nr:PhzF family phenazine biosynthesis protein [Pseudodonghicola xiamenensis]GHG98915.1 phenazine biosynthesis protein PhzF [Pseudodonghicola xiamenensis]
MSRFAFDWVDAFTDRAFGGNGCVVAHQADGLSVAERLALVRETSLSECAFVVASEIADFGARYYLADKEILMAGHPTVATVVSLVDRGLVTLEDGRTEFTLEVGAGVLPITVTRHDGKLNVVMTQAAPQFGLAFDPAEIAAMMSLAPEDILGTPQVVSTGSPFCITVLENKDALRRARLDTDLFYAMNPPGTPRAEVVEPFLVTLGGETEAGDTFSRLLLPPPMPAEDPFTGSATGCMAGYLWHHNLIDRSRFRAEQGHWMGRPGLAEVEVLGPRSAPTGVKVGGQGYVLMRGELELPAA